MSKTNGNNHKNQDWLESQRKWMEAWLAFTQPAAKTSAAAGKNNNPFADMMDYWWKSVSTSLPEGSPEFVNKVMQQGKFFYMLSEQFSRLLNNINEFNQASDDWQSELNKQFEEMKQAFVNNQAGPNQAMHGMWGAWQQLPVDNLRRTFSSASIMPGDFLEDLKPDALQSVTDKFLSIPGVGYTREAQEQAQEGIRLWNNYQKNYHEYNTAMSKVSVDALEAMRQRIIKMAEAGKDIHSLREIYDLWVDCNEDAYAAYAHTGEFSELYGRLTNSLMALKHHGRNIVDEVLGGLNMPTRRGMNTLQKRQQEMRRESKEAARKIVELQDQITELSKHVAGSRHPVSKANGARKNVTSVSVVVAKPKAVRETRKWADTRTKSARKARKKDDKIIIRI